MKKSTLQMFAALFLFAAFFSCNNKAVSPNSSRINVSPNKTFTKMKTGEWNFLFNGKDLEGWEKYGTEKWYVDDGLLICESGLDEKYGYLATEAEFKNFELSLEFQQASDGNSGVFFRCSIEGTKITGWQSEVAPPTKHTGGIYESYGRGWLIKPDPEKDSALKMGEWNEMKILAKGDQITTWLNGTEMVNFSDEKIGAAKGKIALQIHDGGGIKVNWRNIKIKPLK